MIDFSADGIPALLKAANRWAPWTAKWNVRRAKYDKIPKSAHNVLHSLSTAQPQHWHAYQQALQAHLHSNRLTAGVGYVMTGPHGIVGVDLDNCLSPDGEIADWAWEVVVRLDGYTERSPSGKGLRIFVQGEIPHDWTNHSVGIECYAGHQPRFLTVTGARIDYSTEDIPKVDPRELEWLTSTYQEAPRTTAVDAKEMPVPLAPDDLPPLDLLDLSFYARDMLLEGDFGTRDRSSVIFATSVELFREGLSELQVFSTLVHNPHVWEAALDKRQQDEGKAMTFLWMHQTLKAHARWLASAAKVEDFTDLALGWDDTGPDAAAVAGDGAEDDDDFSDLTGDFALEKRVPGAGGVGGVGGALPPLDPDIAELVGDVSCGDAADLGDLVSPAGEAGQQKPEMRFAPIQAAQYARTKRDNRWFVYGVLPQSEMVTIYGESGAGKTFFTLDLVAHVAGGREWRGKRVRRGRVLYVAAEGAGGVADRLKAYSDYHGIDLADLDLHIIGDQPNLLEKADVRDLVKAAQSLKGVDLIVLDTLAQVTPGASENSSEDMGRAISHCKTLRKFTGATIMLVGHSGKDGSKGLRGWSGLKGAMDAMIEVTRTDAYRGATVTKLKDGVGEGTEYLFDFATVDMEDDDFFEEYGERLTSLAVVPLTKDEAALLDAAKAAQGDPSKAQAVFGPGQRGRMPKRQMALLGVISAKADEDGIFKREAVERAWIDYCADHDLYLTTSTGKKKDDRKNRGTEAFEALLEKGLIEYRESDFRYSITEKGKHEQAKIIKENSTAGGNGPPGAGASSPAFDDFDDLL